MKNNIFNKYQYFRSFMASKIIRRTKMLNGDTLHIQSDKFINQLNEVKLSISKDFEWYPYGTLYNFIHLRPFFNRFPLETLTVEKHVADIGAADGDLAFFMASLGYTVDLIDYAPTNFNGLRGARALNQALGYEKMVNIIECDIDDKFSLPQAKYDLVFLLGILYHLKNPYYILEHLSQQARHMLLSTRVMRYTPDEKPMLGLPVAYLLNPAESNNDSTNYWIFTQEALCRLANRCGWEILMSTTVGDTITSNPSDQSRDERAFLLLKSRHT